MPRIPNHQYSDDWEDPNELDIEDDDPKDRLGRKKPRQEREWEEAQREQWRKRNREE
jgi:hypothetical protein